MTTAAFNRLSYQRAKKPRSGVVEVPGRQQPFTVWLDGHVLFFRETREQAEKDYERVRFSL